MEKNYAKFVPIQYQIPYPYQKRIVNVPPIPTKNKSIVHSSNGHVDQHKEFVNRARSAPSSNGQQSDLGPASHDHIQANDSPDIGLRTVSKKNTSAPSSADSRNAPTGTMLYMGGSQDTFDTAEAGAGFGAGDLSTRGHEVYVDEGDSISANRQIRYSENSKFRLGPGVAEMAVLQQQGSLHQQGQQQAWGVMATDEDNSIVGLADDESVRWLLGVVEEQQAHDVRYHEEALRVERLERRVEREIEELGPVAAAFNASKRHSPQAVTLPRLIAPESLLLHYIDAETAGTGPQLHDSATSHPSAGAANAAAGAPGAIAPQTGDFNSFLEYPVQPPPYSASIISQRPSSRPGAAAAGLDGMHPSSTRSGRGGAIPEGSVEIDTDDAGDEDGAYADDAEPEDEEEDDAADAAFSKPPVMRRSFTMSVMTDVEAQGSSPQRLRQQMQMGISGADGGASGREPATGAFGADAGRGSMVYDPDHRQFSSPARTAVGAGIGGTPDAFSRTVQVPEGNVAAAMAASQLAQSPGQLELEQVKRAITPPPSPGLQRALTSGTLDYAPLAALDKPSSPHRQAAQQKQSQPRCQGNVGAPVSSSDFSVGRGRSQQSEVMRSFEGAGSEEQRLRGRRFSNVVFEGAATASPYLTHITQPLVRDKELERLLRDNARTRLMLKQGGGGGSKSGSRKGQGAPPATRSGSGGGSPPFGSAPSSPTAAATAATTRVHADGSVQISVRSKRTGELVTSLPADLHPPGSPHNSGKHSPSPLTSAGADHSFFREEVPPVSRSGPRAVSRGGGSVYASPSSPLLPAAAGPPPPLSRVASSDSISVDDRVLLASVNSVFKPTRDSPPAAGGDYMEYQQHLQRLQRPHYVARAGGLPHGGDPYTAATSHAGPGVVSHPHEEEVSMTSVARHLLRGGRSSPAPVPASVHKPPTTSHQHAQLHVQKLKQRADSAGAWSAAMAAAGGPFSFS